MGAIACLVWVWACYALCAPRRPVGTTEDDQVAWLVYSRRCGARERMLLLALVATGCVLFWLVVNMTYSFPDPCSGARYGDHFC